MLSALLNPSPSKTPVPSWGFEPILDKDGVTPTLFSTNEKIRGVSSASFKEASVITDRRPGELVSPIMQKLIEENLEKSTRDTPPLEDDIDVEKTYFRSVSSVNDLSSLSESYNLSSDSDSDSDEMFFFEEELDQFDLNLDETERLSQMSDLTSPFVD